MQAPQMPKAARHRVAVHVYDRIRETLGTGRLDVELPAGATLAALFAELARRYDPRFAALADDEESPFGVNALVLDGRRVAMPRDAGLELSDGAELHLIPPIGGGSGAPPAASARSEEGLAKLLLVGRARERDELVSRR